MEKEQSVIICKYADSPDILPGGDYSNNCIHCDKQVVVAQSTKNLIKENKITDPVYSCLECFMEHLKEDDEIKIAQPSQEQIDEIKKYINQKSPDVN